MKFLMPQSNSEIAIARAKSLKEMYETALTAFEQINGESEPMLRARNDWRLVYFFLRAQKMPSKYPGHQKQQR